MAKTTDKVVDAAGTVKPYVERALHDEELRLLVLLDDAAIQQRHLPAGEVNHPGAGG